MSHKLSFLPIFSVLLFSSPMSQGAGNDERGADILSVADENEQALVFDAGMFPRPVADSPALQLWYDRLVETCRIYMEDKCFGYESRLAIRDAAIRTLDALNKLYVARNKYGEASLAMCRECYHGEGDDAPDERQMRAVWTRLMEKCLMDDLRALQQSFCYVGGCTWPEAPCSRLKDSMPLVFKGRSGRWGRYRLSGVYKVQAVERWKDMLDDEARAWADSYDPEAGSFTEADWFSNAPIDDFDEIEVERRLPELKRLFVQAEDCWIAYREALSELFCPSREFRGSDTGRFWAELDSYLLTSREKYLAQLAMGMTTPIDPEEPGYTVRVESCSHRYALGEIVRHADFFRHPDLPGKPWCVTLCNDWCTPDKRSFIPLADGEQERKLVASLPDDYPGESISLSVRGYQDIVITGEPYEYPDSSEGPVECEVPVEKRYSAKVVFRIISFDPPKLNDTTGSEEPEE